MRVGAVLILCITAVAPMVPLYGGTPAGANSTNKGAIERDIVLRGQDGTNQPAVFSSIGIRVVPGDIVIEAGGNAHSSCDEGLTGETILQLGHVSGTDVFHRKNTFTRKNPLNAIIDRDGRLILGDSVASLVRKNEATGEETVFTDPSLLGDKYGIAVDYGTGSTSPGNSPLNGSQSGNSSPGG